MIRKSRTRDGETKKKEVYVGNRKRDAEGARKKIPDREFYELSKQGVLRTEEEDAQSTKLSENTRRLQERNRAAKSTEELEADGARDAQFIADTASWHPEVFGEFDDSPFENEKKKTKAHFERMRACLARL